MQYVRLNSIGDVLTYPYSIGEMAGDFYNVSFPIPLTDSILSDYAVFPVQPTAKPDHNPATEAVVEGNPQLINGVWTQTWGVVQLSPEEITEKTANKAQEVRTERDSRLVASDWTQLPDAPVDSVAWAAYREQLRNISDQPGFPWDITWPAEPA